MVRPGVSFRCELCTREHLHGSEGVRGVRAGGYRIVTLCLDCAERAPSSFWNLGCMVPSLMRSRAPWGPRSRAPNGGRAKGSRPLPAVAV